MKSRVIQEYRFILNPGGRLLLTLDAIGCLPDQPRLYYNGGANALFCKRPDEVFLIADIAPEIRHYLAFTETLRIAEADGETYGAECIFAHDIPALRKAKQEIM